MTCRSGILLTRLGPSCSVLCCCSQPLAYLRCLFSFSGDASPTEIHADTLVLQKASNEATYLWGEGLDISLSNYLEHHGFSDSFDLCSL